ncbi:low molecular weight phosphotyrosine protein phosphatase [Fulvivirga ulvae]|uniref:low molecular weight protein-tyrosine-phosphatase n=1 Tax=Fulvivirga ulvae TaxID=2904245 RepID=UPI001F19E5E8|nr:low molecular weight protein-tyrosine-phosphatase [Fulvivirga ulvae]UII32985.1 low molecular weight phosphotyrosine protein phosphatase [Fulvivirga ulvae]
MIKVLFVCLGNICRSPLAQGLMEMKIDELGLNDQIKVDSCGTSQYHIGEQPDERTLKNALKNGLKLEHQARQFSRKDFRTFDYIVTMDKANMDCVKRLDQTNEFSDKFMLIRDFDPVDKGADVPDPYFGGEEGFQHVYLILQRSVSEFLNQIIKTHGLNVSIS